VPRGWSRTTFGEVASFKNGLNFTKNDGGETIKIVGVSDFKNHTELRGCEKIDYAICNILKNNGKKLLIMDFFTTS